MRNKFSFKYGTLAQLGGLIWIKFDSVKFAEKLLK